MAPPRLAFILLLAALLLDSAQSASAYTIADDGWAAKMTDVLVGDVIGEAEEEMGTEAERRILAQTKRYISYGAMDKNRVPCNRRGHSYYNCQGGQRANPYRRGCSAITRCRRNIN